MSARKVLKSVFLGSSLAAASSYYLFPELLHDYKQMGLAWSRAFRLGLAGIRMAYIYGLVIFKLFII
jgi:hypothetical protein